jgi:hypothetical protein
MGGIGVHTQMVAQISNLFKIRARLRGGILTPTMAATLSYVMVASILDGDFLHLIYEARANTIKLVQRGTH